MRLIDADALIGALHNHAFLEGDDRSICYNIIQKQPTIDAVPVIRCEDCLYWGKSKHATWKRCGMIEIVTPYNFYCACGERRNND